MAARCTVHSCDRNVLKEGECREDERLHGRHGGYEGDGVRQRGEGGISHETPRTPPVCRVHKEEGSVINELSVVDEQPIPVILLRHAEALSMNAHALALRLPALVVLHSVSAHALLRQHSDKGQSPFLIVVLALSVRATTAGYDATAGRSLPAPAIIALQYSFLHVFSLNHVIHFSLVELNGHNE